MHSQLIFYSNQKRMLVEALSVFEPFVESGINLTVIAKPTQLDVLTDFDKLHPGCLTISNISSEQEVKDRVKYLKIRFGAQNSKFLINRSLSKKTLESLSYKKTDAGSDKPLVSIAIYNYNYGPYIGECLESVVNQSYKKIEICISDNASDDDSWEIICDYIKKHPKRIKAIKKPMNMGPGFNRQNAEYLCGGKYLLVLASDDYIATDYIEKAVKALESNDDCAFVMVHRDIVHEDGSITKEMPFYDRTCKILGEAQASVFMMAGVNPSISQIVYRRSMLADGTLIGGHALNSRWFADRIRDFELCCRHPILYINEPLLKNRVHFKSDGSTIDRNLIQAVGQFLLVHQFSEIADVYGNKMAKDRLPDAIWKISTLCLRYSLVFLARGDEEISKKYFLLSLAFQNQHNETEAFDLLFGYHLSGNKGYLNRLLKLSGEAGRSISYAPPEGSQCIVLK